MAFGIFFFFKLQHVGSLAAACRMFSYKNVNSLLRRMGSSSLTRDGTRAPCSGGTVLAAGPAGSSLQLLFNVTYTLPHVTVLIYVSEIHAHLDPREAAW